MSYSNFENPVWLRDAVAVRARGRTSLGALRKDYNKFLSLFNVIPVRFPSALPVEIPNSETVVEVVKKQYFNNSGQDDEVEIKGQKTSTHSSGRNHQLTIGKDKTKQFTQLMVMLA